MTFYPRDLLLLVGRRADVFRHDALRPVEWRVVLSVVDGVVRIVEMG